MQYSELSRNRQSILTLCREINFGYLTDISVVNGELHATERTRKCTLVKLDRAPSQIPAAAPYDYTLCAAQEQFIRTLQHMGNGCLKSIEIRDGRPVSVNIEEVVAAF